MFVRWWWTGVDGMVCGMLRVCFWAVMTAVGVASATTGASAQSLESCSQTLGRARAQRLVNQCINTSTATHPPCNAVNDCATISEHIAFMCKNNLGANPPAYCGESEGLSKLSERGVGERYEKTIAAEHRHIRRLGEELRQTRLKLEPLAQQNKDAALAVKKSRLDFDQEVRLAKAAYAKYKAASVKPTTLDLDAVRHDLLAQLDAVVKHEKELAKDAAAITATDLRLAELNSDATIARLSIKDQLRDMKEAKLLIDAGAAKLALDAKKQPALLADATALKAASVQAAATIQAVVPMDAEAGKTAAAVTLLAQATPSGVFARSLAFKAAQKSAVDRALAETEWREIDQAQRSADARRSPTAPSAKSAGCDLERVDFRNFSYAYPENPKVRPSVYKNGTEGGSKDEWANKISSVKYFDLDGIDKKEAVVFIQGPPSAHSGPQNELIFLQLDPQCRVQTLKRLSGGVTEGVMKAKSYFYGDTILEGVEGMGGNFATGTETVELRYVNGELKEFSRKVDR